MMLLRKNHRHTGMDLRYKRIRLPCDNRTSAQPLPRFGISPVSQRPAKVNGRPSFMGDREWQLRFSRFAPFAESVRWNRGELHRDYFVRLPLGLYIGTQASVGGRAQYGGRRRHT